MNNIFIVSTDEPEKQKCPKHFARVGLKNPDSLGTYMYNLIYLSIPCHNLKNDNYGNKIIDHLEKIIIMYRKVHIYPLKDIFVHSGTARERFELSQRINYIKRWLKE